jgi:sugar/nucleoside kinase (ribokinase family)
MQLAIVSNIVKDKIILETQQITYSLGGPPCYCGLVAKQFGAKVRLITKYGEDFSKSDLLFFRNSGFQINESSFSKYPTTKFTLQIQDSDRELYLLNKCDSIYISDLDQINTDCWIVSPVFDEVPYSVLEYLIEHNDKDFLMLDPQGYTRKLGTNNKILINENLDSLFFKNIDAIKLDPKELYCFSGGDDIIALRKLKLKNNINYALYSENKRIHMLNEDKHYWLNINKVETSDSTGAGDIFASAFTCAFIKERDPLWAFSFGVGAVMAALRSKKNGIDKIPKKKYIEENASYNYNLIKYESF